MPASSNIFLLLSHPCVTFKWCLDLSLPLVLTIWVVCLYWGEDSPSGSNLSTRVRSSSRRRHLSATGLSPYTWVQKCKTVLKRWPEVPNMANWPGGIRDSGNMCLQIKHVRFFEKMSFSQPRGPPEKVGGHIFMFTVIFFPLIILAVNRQKMHFNGQNQKKWRKRTPIIFWFYMKICPPTFSGGPLGWENDIISEFCLIMKFWLIFP